MFYGLNDSKRSVAENERLKFKPWNSTERFGGYIEFELERCSEYFVTMSAIGNKVVEDSSTNIFMILTIISIMVIIGLVAFIFVKIRPLKKKNKRY